MSLNQQRCDSVLPFKFWTERRLPVGYETFLQGIASVSGCAEDTPGAPFKNVANAQAIIASSRMRYDGAVMDQAPFLRVISRTGAGFDNIVIRDASARGVAVCIAPQSVTVATAEHAVALMLAVAKRLKWAQQRILSSDFDSTFDAFDGLELQGSVLGLVGLGRIARHVAQICAAFGMTVMGYDPYVPKQLVNESIITLMPTLESLLCKSDIVSIHVTLSAETRGLFNRQRIEQMKLGAILINTSRGAVVEERALLAALQSRHLSGAGLDVFTREPPELENQLLHRLDVVATPHVAAATPASRQASWRMAIQSAIDILQGKPPPNVVNPEAVGAPVSQPKR